MLEALRLIAGGTTPVDALTSTFVAVKVLLACFMSFDLPWSCWSPDASDGEVTVSLRLTLQPIIRKPSCCRGHGRLRDPLPMSEVRLQRGSSEAPLWCKVGMGPFSSPRARLPVASAGLNHREKLMGQLWAYAGRSYRHGQSCTPCAHHPHAPHTHTHTRSNRSSCKALQRQHQLNDANQTAARLRLDIGKSRCSPECF